MKSAGLFHLIAGSFCFEIFSAYVRGVRLRAIGEATEILVWNCELCLNRRECMISVLSRPRGLRWTQLADFRCT